MLILCLIKFNYKWLSLNIYVEFFISISFLFAFMIFYRHFSIYLLFFHVLKLSSYKPKKHLVIHEYSQTMIKMVYPTYEQSDIQTFEPFEYQREHYLFLLNSPFYFHRTNRFDILIHRKDFINLMTYNRIHPHKNFYKSKYVPTFWILHLKMFEDHNQLTHKHLVS